MIIKIKILIDYSNKRDLKKNSGLKSVKYTNKHTNIENKTPDCHNLPSSGLTNFNCTISPLIMTKEHLC